MTTAIRTSTRKLSLISTQRRLFSTKKAGTSELTSQCDKDTNEKKPTGELTSFQLSTQTNNNLIQTSPATQSWSERLHKLWSEASGDQELSALKQNVVEKSKIFDDTVLLVKKQRRSVENWQQRHEIALQRHANLLSKRDAWTAQEAADFVEITAKEVEARQKLGESRNELHLSEERASSQQREYMDALRMRYQEEQAWQEKWRVLGTYGTWALIGLNSMVFVVGQYLLQRREYQRLQHIETLIVSRGTSTNVEKDGQAVISIETKEKDAPETTSQETFTDSTTRIGSDKVSQDAPHSDACSASDSADETPEQYIDNQQQGFTLVHLWEECKARLEPEWNVDVPSAVLGGATASAAFICIAVLVSQTRKT